MTTLPNYQPQRCDNLLLYCFIFPLIIFHSLGNHIQTEEKEYNADIDLTTLLLL